ncbi:Pex32p NDAI_0C05830 [Naumovozyma dairenensis CBS 421]|uniref:Peroxin/Ferlin domain-containing protein n=1 Tax=Naumovozyma dairenensis (strain ATCC 10597 / BCRC 20456 / CBS 421 / NBRC 0211 / NRRL Y-12639) TaxID=1071378 RepID=G0W8Y1_NAUDC|nr:hypothetical protein NDAI_0C05830 [Naumovozyma dairenensis CBS 421]CCD24242.1 hypothetical protein NDAI_0C05830 [Naumovozyma dairenensis CBS 421]
MSTFDNENNGKEFHAKFSDIHPHHDQVISIPLATSIKASKKYIPSIMTISMSNIYPFLIIIDNCLNRILWLHNTHYHYFNYVIFIFLSMKYFLQETVRFKFDDILTAWLGLVSTIILCTSILYYIVALFHDLKTADPPTIEDIINQIDSITNKLRILQRESFFSSRKSYSVTSICKIITISSVIQWILIKWISITIQKYVLICVIASVCYHCDWVQYTLKLIWRITLVRNIYHWDDIIWKKWFGGAPVTNLETLIKYTDNRQPHREEQEPGINESFVIKDWYIDLDHYHHVDQENENAEPKILKILEIIIWENQRKWLHLGWLTKLFPYERGQFSIVKNQEGNEHIDCNNPLSFEQVDDHYKWLEDSWQIDDWIYSTSSWEYVGLSDSIECYTRSRPWKRKVALFPSVKDLPLYEKKTQ